jgi:hypothetical protein
MPAAATGFAREIFADGFRSGSDVEGALDDQCILTSKVLQAGEAPADLAVQLGAGAIGADGARPALTMLAQLAQLAAEIEAEEGALLAAVFGPAEGVAL